MTNIEFMLLVLRFNRTLLSSRIATTTRHIEAVWLVESKRFMLLVLRFNREYWTIATSDRGLLIEEGIALCRRVGGRFTRRQLLLFTNECENVMFHTISNRSEIKASFHNRLSDFFYNIRTLIKAIRIIETDQIKIRKKLLNP